MLKIDAAGNKGTWEMLQLEVECANCYSLGDPGTMFELHWLLKSAGNRNPSSTNTMYDPDY